MFKAHVWLVFTAALTVLGIAAAYGRQPFIAEIVVNENGSFVWNGDYVADLAGLKLHFAEHSGELPRPKIHVRLTRKTPYRQLAKVMSLAESHGYSDGIVGNEHFGQ